MNQGYDIWLVNNRGNKYSRTHIQPDIKEEEFYDYSFQDFGLKDLPAVYKFIIKTSAPKKIHYIGNHQGNTQMFVALSDPLTSKFISDNTSTFIALSPMLYRNKITAFPLLVKLLRNSGWAY